MKRLSKISVVLLISLLCILGLSTTAFAEETQSSDGLQASIATNSAEYKTNDDIKVELKVKNTNDFDINSVSMNTVVPNGLTVKDNASTSKTVGTLKSGNEESYSIILNVQSTSSGTGTTSTSPQTGNTANSTAATTDTESSVGTGDVRNISVLAIILVGSAVLMIYNRKKLSKHISIMLCFAICLTSIAAVDISSANAAEQNSFTVSKTIKVDDKSYTIGLKISYDKNSITDAVNLTGYKMSEASAYIDNDLYADVEDLSHVAVDSDTRISYFDNEVSFMVNDGVTERDVVDKIINKYDAIIVGKSSTTGRYLVRFNNKTYTYNEIINFQNELLNNSLVESAYPNYAIEIDEESYEPQGDLWSGTYDNIPSGDNWGVEAINAPEAWDYYDLMNDVNVGVFDSVFQSTIDDLKNVIINHSDSSSEIDDHGAHVSGIIAAQFDNGIGINGVCPTAKLSTVNMEFAKSYDELDIDTDSYREIDETLKESYGVRITNAFHYCNAYDYLIDRCNCKVVNMSMGSYVTSFVASLTSEDECYDLDMVNKCKNVLTLKSIPLADTLKSLLRKNKDFTICVAAGNTNGVNVKFVKDSNATYGFRQYNAKTDKNRAFYTKNDCKADYVSLLTVISDDELKDRIIVVGAIQNNGNNKYSLASYSCIGERVDVVAPGSNIQSTVNNHDGESDFELEKRRIIARNENGKTNYYRIMDGTSMASPHVAGIAAMLYALNPELDGAMVKQIICHSAHRTVGTYHLVDADAAVEEVRLSMVLDGQTPSSKLLFTYGRQVLDENKNPISGVNVKIEKLLKSGRTYYEQKLTTDENGYFNFTEYAGKGKITLEKEGYETVTIEDNFEKGAIYVNKYPVTMKKIVDDKQYTASELVNRDLYDILAELGDDYTLDNYGCLKYEKYGFTLVTDFNRNISTTNEFSDPLPESEKQRFNEALNNKTLTLRYINVFGDGKLDDNINAQMSYNDLTSYYGEFDCNVANRSDIANSGPSLVYSYDVINEAEKIIVNYSFGVEENAKPNYSGETAESMKRINPKLYQIRVYPGYDGYFKPTSTDWANAYADYIQTNKGNDDIKFALGYVDNDNVPELFITRGGYHALGVEFYTYKDGNVVKLGNSGSIGSNGTAAYAPKQGIIHGGHVGMGTNMGHFDELNNGILTRRISYIHYDEDINSVSKGKYYFDNNEDNKTSDDEEVTEKEYFDTVNSYINNYNYVAIGWDSAINYAVDTTINELRKEPYNYLNPDEVNSHFLSYDEVIYEVINNN